MSCIAGPSRLPFTAARTLSRSSLLHTSARRGAEVAESSARNDDDDPHDERAVRRAERVEKAFWGQHAGFQKWKNSDGLEYGTAPPGSRAKWFGGSIPFPSNPSFRPPPPLSNDLQDVIYRELVKGTKTVGALSAEFSVSKARIEAIRKLKEIEAEMIRQGLPLQTAFREGMEPLLGVVGLTDKNRMISERLAREDIQIREAMDSTSVEQDEEHRFEHGVGGGGAFAARAARGESDVQEGLERSVFEWRDEEAAVEDRVAAEQLARDNRAKGEEVEFQTRFTIPASRQAQPVSTDKVDSSVKVVPVTASTAYRFVEVGKVEQPKHLAKKQKQRARQREKKR